MENIFVEFLPPWVETGLQPAFYDKESGTCLQQTARMYDRVNMLVRMFNKLSKNTKTTVEDYITKFNELHDYVHDYFDNLDVQQEINNKLDEMVENGVISQLLSTIVQPTIDELNNNFETLESNVNAEIKSISNLVDSAVAQTPIVVSSTSDMTDTTKVYVNSTDGKWYYYDGANWTAGGTYQATAISSNSVDKYMTKFRKQSGNNLFDWTSATIYNYNINNEAITSNPDTKCIVLPVSEFNTYTISKIAGARFRVSSFGEFPVVGSTRTATVTDNSATSLELAIPEGSTYICVFFYLNGHETNTLESVLKSITITKANKSSYPNSLDYYALSIGNKDLNNDSVSPDKTTFSKATNNIFDINNPNIINCFFTAGYPRCTMTDPLMRSVYVECEPNTRYDIIKPSNSRRLGVGYTKQTPAPNVDIYGIISNNDSHKITITTGEDATHIIVFMCKTDIMSFEEAISGFMIYKGQAPNYYVPHKVIEVNTENINDGCITADKLASSITGNNYLSSRSKVYGITFDVTEDDPDVTRIADATGLKNDYVVGNTYQLNGGVNDFDNIYPWSDMRLCNVKFDEQGNKIITYADEDDFARDGSNGEVMVEIPKFYSFRQRIGNQETWAISGEKKAGFEVEPLFMVNGKEIDYAYIGAYDGTGRTVESVSGYLPKVNTSLSQFIANYSAKNLQSYDITCFWAIQKLMMIEFATRNLQKYLGGITNQAYVSATLNPDGVIKDIPSANTVKIAYDSNERPKYYFVGMNIKFADCVNTSRDFTTDVRKITSITEDGSYLVIEYDGEDLSNDLEVDTWGVYGMGQDNGLTDNLIYHTGRTNFTTIGTDITKKNLNNPFKYRNIENVYGNVWERLAGIRVKNLKAYINYEPNSYTINSDWKTANYTLPLQTQAGHVNQAWIVEEHYDRNDPLVVLPSKIGSSNGGGDNKFYSDSFYSNNASNFEYEAVCGGAWDHYVYAGAFTIRVYINPGDQQWLNGNRPIVR